MHISRPQPQDTYQAMCDARTAFFAAWRAWLATRPSFAEAKMEADATASVLRQLLNWEQAA